MVLPEQNWLVSNNFSVYQNTRSPDCLTRRLSRSWRRSPWSWWCRLTWTWAIKPRPPRLFPEGSRRIQVMLVLLTRIIYIWWLWWKHLISAEPAVRGTGVVVSGENLEDRARRWKEFREWNFQQKKKLLWKLFVKYGHDKCPHGMKTRVLYAS